MARSVQDKLAAIIADIEASGSVNQTRLTVLKKWFERPGRVSLFGLWVVTRAAGRGETAKESAVGLYAETQALLNDWSVADAGPSRVDARALHERLKSFQDECQRQRFGPVRLIKDWNLLLIEQGLALYLHHSNSPAEGYRLASDYCVHYDSRYGTGLNGPSRDRVREVLEFVAGVESNET